LNQGVIDLASFAYQLKNELARNVLDKRCCACAELRAFLQLSGKLLIRRNSKELVLQTQSAALARRLFSLFKFSFELSPQILFSRKNKLQKNNTYFLRIMGKKEAWRVLMELDFFTFHPQNGRLILKTHPSLVSRDEPVEKCCRRAYLAGAFLAGGSMSNPEATYHLEITAPYETYARLIVDNMAFFALPTRYFQRKDDYVVYLKGGEKIGEFLRVISASNALLEFENIRVVKGIRNKTNRLVNCETANLTKTVVAAWEQINDIKVLEETLGLDNLLPSLAQVARLRLMHPEATLRELAAAAVPPLTKSGVYHRLRRIGALAQKIRSGEGV
jgi:DNA-binding protein WhiA